jgi:hypothetical protein
MKRDVDPRILAFIQGEVRKIGRIIDSSLNPNLNEKEYGFAIFLFSFDGPEFTWLSNAEREDMIKVLKELIDKFERGRQDELHNIGN